MNGAQILGIFLVILVVVVICSSIRVVPQAHAYVIERLGTYNTTWSAGLHLKTPLIDKVAHRISMKEQVVDFAPQPVITKDNVTMRIDTVVFFQITDPKLFAYGVEKPIMAIENLTATTLRNIIGELELDQTLTSRENQYKDACDFGRGDRSLGYQGQPCRAEEYHSTGSYSGCDGKTDEGRA